MLPVAMHASNYNSTRSFIAIRNSWIVFVRTSFGAQSKKKGFRPKKPKIMNL